MRNEEGAITLTYYPDDEGHVVDAAQVGAVLRGLSAYITAAFEVVKIHRWPTEAKLDPRLMLYGNPSQGSVVFDLWLVIAGAAVSVGSGLSFAADASQVLGISVKDIARGLRRCLGQAEPKDIVTGLEMIIAQEIENNERAVAASKEVAESAALSQCSSVILRLRGMELIVLYPISGTPTWATERQANKEKEKELLKAIEQLDEEFEARKAILEDRVAHFDEVRLREETDNRRQAGHLVEELKEHISALEEERAALRGQLEQLRSSNASEEHSSSTREL